MILLDTVVVSALRKNRPDLQVIAWMRGLREAEVLLSIGAVAETERDVRNARDADFAAALTTRLEDSLRFYRDRVWPVTLEIARLWGWGRLSADLGHESADLLTAATAAALRLTVASRNVRQFAPTGVPAFDPFKARA